MPVIIRKRLLSPETVRAIRVAKGLSLRQVAADACVSIPYLSRIERGERVPGLGTILALAAALGVPAQAISYQTEDAA